MELESTLTANDGRVVKMAAHQAHAIQELNNTKKATFANVVGYQPSTNWIEKPVQDIQMIAHISIPNLYKRRLTALNALEFADVLPLCMDDPILSGEKPDTDKAKTVHGVKTLLALFEARKTQEIESLEKSLAAFAGEEIETDAHREAHKRCYAHFGSVKVNLVTEGNPKMPVTDSQGRVELASIMVPYIEVNVTTREEGEKKKVNSGGSVRMKNQINRAMAKRSIQLKTLSLKADNFEALNIDGKEFLPEDVNRYGDILTG